MALLLPLNLHRKLFFLKTAFYHIIIYFLSGIIFLSTTGVSVHHLYCFCKGEATASFVRPDDPCEEPGALHEKDCCAGGGCHDGDSRQKHDCSTCVSQYVKLDVQYLLPSVDLKITAPAVHWPGFLLVEINPVFQKSCISWHQDIPPPPPSGRELLFRIQSFLC